MESVQWCIGLNETTCVFELAESEFGVGLGAVGGWLREYLLHGVFFEEANDATGTISERCSTESFAREGETITTAEMVAYAYIKKSKVIRS